MARKHEAGLPRARARGRPETVQMSNNKFNDCPLNLMLTAGFLTLKQTEVW